MWMIRCCAVGFTAVNDEARPSCDEPGTGERSLLSVDPAQRSEVIPVVDGTPVVNAREFYAAQRAEQEQKDRATRAELAGYWKGCEGAPRETPLIGELRDAWLLGYDTGTAAVAAKAVA